MDLWVPMYSLCMLASLPHVSVLSFSEICVLFLCQKKGGVSTASSLLCVVISIAFCFVFCASWWNDSCAVPLTFSSFSVSHFLSLFLSLSASSFVFCSFFRTTLHACLLIISLACLHDVERQAKLLASSSHHCLWCLSKLTWPIPGHPLTLDLSSTWIFFACFFCAFVLYRNVTGGRERSNKSMWKTNLCWIHLRLLFFLCFFANVLKTCGISYF